MLTFPGIKSSYGKTRELISNLLSCLWVQSKIISYIKTSHDFARKTLKLFWRFLHNILLVNHYSKIIVVTVTQYLNFAISLSFKFKILINWPCTLRRTYVYKYINSYLVNMSGVNSKMLEFPYLMKAGRYYVCGASITRGIISSRF